MIQNLIDSLCTFENPVAQLVVIIGIAAVVAIDGVRLPVCAVRPETSDGADEAARRPGAHREARYGVGDVGSKVFT